MGQKISTVIENKNGRTKNKKNVLQTSVLPEFPNPTEEATNINRPATSTSAKSPHSEQSDSEFEFPTLPQPPSSHGVLSEPTSPVPETSEVPPPTPSLEDDKLLLFAGKRISNAEGGKYIVLFGPKSEKLFHMNEDHLKKNYQIVLGNFLEAKLEPDGSLGELQKVPAIGNAHVKVVEDTAFVFNVHVKLVHVFGRSVFTCEKFARAISHKPLKVGNYHVKISMLSYPVKLADGTMIYLEGTCHNRSLGPAIKAPPQETEIPDVLPEAEELLIKAGLLKQEPTAALESEKSSQGVIFGAGFEEYKEPEPEVIFGAGFKEYKEPEPQIIFGAGFEQDQQPLKVPLARNVKKRALVLNIRKSYGRDVYDLWMLEDKEEGLFEKESPILEIGQFFTGTFSKRKSDPDTWRCKECGSSLECLIPWSLDSEGKICLMVRVQGFQPAGVGRRFGEAHAMSIGVVVEGETGDTKLSDETNGKLVKIQRQQISEKDRMWRVVEIL